jgi:hypothetical protein
MHGIKETMEAVQLIEKVAEAIAAAKADGSIDWKDLGKLGPVVVAMKDAVAGGQMLQAELKDLNAGETQLLFEAIVNATGKLVSAIIV